MEDYFYKLVEQFGIYAVFLLCMVEGDITLLLAGVLAQNRSFGDYSFGRVVFFGTLGAMIGDTFGYVIGRVFRKSVSNYRFYQLAQPRIENMTEKFGAASVFISKYIYGLRAAWCIFFGVARMPLWKFLLLDFGSCLLWVLILSSIGYFFSGAITGLIGNFKQASIVLLIVAVIGVIGFYLFERFWLAKKVEQVSPETIHTIEQAAHNTLHDISEGIHERLHPNQHRPPVAVDRNQNNGDERLPSAKSEAVEKAIEIKGES